jgi:hypothetical protein
MKHICIDCFEIFYCEGHKKGIDDDEKSFHLCRCWVDEFLKEDGTTELQYYCTDECRVNWLIENDYDEEI